MTQPEMTQPEQPGRKTAIWTAVAVLLAIGVAGPLLVPVYARTGPRLGGFPFFYWYQLMWVPIDAILVSVAYLLSLRAMPSRRPKPAAGPAGERVAR